MRAQDTNKATAAMVVPIRDADDCMYVQGHPDRVVVTVATGFDNPSDVTLGKVFLQEFHDVRQMNKMQNAPAVIYGKEPPSEFSSLLAKSASSSSLNYITFGTFICLNLIIILIA